MCKLCLFTVAHLVDVLGIPSYVSMENCILPDRCVEALRAMYLLHWTPGTRFGQGLLAAAPRGGMMLLQLQLQALLELLDLQTQPVPLPLGRQRLLGPGAEVRLEPTALELLGPQLLSGWGGDRRTARKGLTGCSRPHWIRCLRLAAECTCTNRSRSCDLHPHPHPHIAFPISYLNLQS